jgi:glycosyltransferase involved in cell wall biosynthesis
MMDPTPTISVLMSVFNTPERYLRQAVQSILGQTFSDLEFIIIDDGSTDRSPAVLREYASRDPRIRLTVRTNKGLTVTLNEAIGVARGELLARMDCDDVALADRFEKQLSFLRADASIVCAGGYFALIDEKDRLLTRLRPPTDDAAIQDLLLRGHTAICHPAAMMRADAVRKVGGYDPYFKTTQDLDLWLRLGEVGKLGNVPEVVLKFRQHGASISETRREEQRRFGREACERAWQRRGLSGMRFEAEEPWRPGADRSSRHRYALRYGWWAFNSGERRTAASYGWRAIRIAPWKVDGWRLLLVAGMKRGPSRADSADTKFLPLPEGEGKEVAP